MKRSKILARLPVLGLLVGLGACQDLVVPNQNNPDRERAISQPGDVETLIKGGWPAFWGRTQTSASSVNTMPLVGDEFSATYANNGALEMSSEPRVAFNNNPVSDPHETARFQWYDFYSGLSNANEGLIAMDRGLKITEGAADNTMRARTFAKFIQGLSLGYIALQFDRAWVATEKDTDVEKISADIRSGARPAQPYTAVMDSAIALLREAAQLAETNTFQLDETWITNYPVDNRELARIANSFIARFLILNARTPADRAKTNWNAVLEHTSKGITKDVAPTLVSGVLTSGLVSRHQNTTTFSSRADNMLIGWADVSGNFQRWLQTPLQQRDKFLITTPDRRITGATPTSNGKYFRYRPTEIMNAARGTYHFSWYQFFRDQGLSTTGNRRIMSVDEMNLYRAEALHRLGRNAEAAQMVNVTRVRNGELPPVTADGVPQGATCVPRTATGACGSLWDAIRYERYIEMAGTDALYMHLNRRGEGTLPRGTFLHFPIPARELQSLGMPVYTFGGGLEWSAP